MLDFALLLELEGIDPKRTVIMRHTPEEPNLRKSFPWLAEEHPDLYNMYQRGHGPRAEATLKRADYLASFIGLPPRNALFVGMYRVEGYEPINRPEYADQAEVRRLIELGMRPWDDANRDIRSERLQFDLRHVESLHQWKGRLVVEWPPGIAWCRWVRPQRSPYAVRSIHEESLLVPGVPSWQEMSLSWQELKALPQSWRAALAQWRGIYFISDRSDGKAYVGSAYGGDNILGRWRNYGSTGHGGNQLLRERDPANFSFSILQRLSPDLPAEDVVAIESSWKTRLHTRAPLGLNAN
jgi:hypothetical protein